MTILKYNTELNEYIEHSLNDFLNSLTLKSNENIVKSIRLNEKDYRKREKKKRSLQSYLFHLNFKNKHASVENIDSFSGLFVYNIQMNKFSLKERLKRYEEVKKAILTEFGEYVFMIYQTARGNIKLILNTNFNEVNRDIGIILYKKCFINLLNEIRKRLECLNVRFDDSFRVIQYHYISYDENYYVNENANAYKFDLNDYSSEINLIKKYSNVKQPDEILNVNPFVPKLFYLDEFDTIIKALDYENMSEESIKTISYDLCCLNYKHELLQHWNHKDVKDITEKFEHEYNFSTVQDILYNLIIHLINELKEEKKTEVIDLVNRKINMLNYHTHRFNFPEYKEHYMGLLYPDRYEKRFGFKEKNSNENKTCNFGFVFDTEYMKHDKIYANFDHYLDMYNERAKRVISPLEFKNKIEQNSIGDQVVLSQQIKYAFMPELKPKIFSNIFNGVDSDFKPYEHSSVFEMLPYDLEIIENLDDFDSTDFLNFKSYHDLETHQESFQSLQNRYSIIDLNVIVYAHFAVTDVFKMFTSKSLFKHYLDFVMQKNDNFSDTKNFRFTFNGTSFLKFPIVLRDKNINKFFCLNISVIDTISVFGMQSYGKLADITNTPLPSKDILTTEDKGDMFSTYFKSPENFKAYSLGDLECDNFLKNTKRIYLEILKDTLGVSDEIIHNHFEQRLSLGSNINQFLKSFLTDEIMKCEEFSSQFKKERYFEKHKKIKAQIEKLCSFHSGSKLLETDVDTFIPLLCKVLGGRGNNNRPTDISSKGVNYDVDISGCYATILSHMTYKIGYPNILGNSFKKNIPIEKQPLGTLRSVWKDINKNVYKNYYNIWFIVPKELNFYQDFIPTFEVHPDFFDIMEQNIEEGYEGESLSDWSEKNNLVKVYTKRLGFLPKKGFGNSKMGVCLATSNEMEFIFNFLKPKDRDFILDNAIVMSASYYDKKGRCETMEEFMQKTKHNEENNLHEEKFVSVRDSKGHERKVKQTITSDRMFYWYEIELGKKFVQPLFNKRKMLKKGTSMERALKVINNSIYGVLVSIYFLFSNTMDANIITSSARTMVYAMEKSLNSYQTITDGGIFNVNEVLYTRKNKKRLNMSNVAYLSYFMKKDKNHLKNNNIYLAPLGNYDKIEYDNEGNYLFYKDGEIKSLEISEAMKYVSKLAMEHVTNLFKDVFTVVKDEIFTLEGKGFCLEASFYSKLNYCIMQGNHEEINKPKIRGLASKEYALPYFQSLLENPCKVRRSDVILNKTLINNTTINIQHKYKIEQLKKAGDEIFIPRLIREFSIGSFNFLSHTQYEAWDKKNSSLKNKYLQSFEMPYILRETDGEYVNVQKMMEDIEEVIVNKKSLLPYMKSTGCEYDITHPKYSEYMKLKDGLSFEDD